MKMKCKACKGKAGDKACKACRGAGYIQKMKMEEGDEAYDMKKASVFLKGLRDMDIAEDVAQTIVKGKIESGEIQDDLDAAALNVDDLDAAVLAMKAAAAGDYLADEPGADLVQKGGDDLTDALLLDDVDVLTAFNAIADAESSVAKGLNKLGYEQRAGFEVVTKGLLATAKLVRDTATALKAQGEHLAHIQSRQDQIAKAMGQPIPPRSYLSGAIPIPAPLEGNVVKGGIETEGQDITGTSGADVMKAAQFEYDDILKAGPVTDITKKQRLGELATAISRCESGGINPVEIMEEFKIKVA